MINASISVVGIMLYIVVNSTIPVPVSAVYVPDGPPVDLSAEGYCENGVFHWEYHGRINRLFDVMVTVGNESYLIRGSMPFLPLVIAISTNVVAMAVIVVLEVRRWKSD